MNQNKILLIIAAILIGLGLLKPDIADWISINRSPNAVVSIENYVIDAPSDMVLLNSAQKVIDLLATYKDSSDKSELLKLSCLYCDIATLIELDGEDEIIKDTATIKEANSLCGKMLRLNIKDKYPNLAETSRQVVVTAIGDDDVLLDENLRLKSVEAFRALSWAFYEGGK